MIHNLESMKEFLIQTPTGLPLNQDLYDSYKDAKVDGQTLRDSDEK